MAGRAAVALLLLVVPARSQPSGAKPFDPRHYYDRRCLPAVALSPAGQVLDPGSTSAFMLTPLAPGATVHDCAELCCHDWSCESFLFCAKGDQCSKVGGHEGNPINGSCTPTTPCCAFKDDASDPLTSGSTWPGITTGKRSMLSAKSPPYPNSSAVPQVAIEPKLYIGVNGDEFPITWGRDGAQYSGAGDNKQIINGKLAESPLSFFKVTGGPTEMGCSVETPGPNHTQPSPVCKNVTMQGQPIVVNSPSSSKACPNWHTDCGDGTPCPNLKSSGVLSVGGILYWAVSCFNYGDDEVFNRQRYGPAWIITSSDGGVTFNETATPTDMFPGRLAAPRFFQYGKDYAGAPHSGRYVYVFFPGTQGDSAFFENNDQILLGRVPTAQVLDRASYEFYTGPAADGVVEWTSDATIATHVWEFPLMTSVQQVNYHPGLKKYIFANWAWISYDGSDLH